MLTRVEIDGFKSFEKFSVDLRPFCAIVGPNASGKSNFFDALRFLSLLSEHSINDAMQGLRGKPEELFRNTSRGPSPVMSFAVEMLVDRRGHDGFGIEYEVKAQRLRYELELEMQSRGSTAPARVFVRREKCTDIKKKGDRALFAKGWNIAYASNRKMPYLDTVWPDNGDPPAFEIRQDGLTGENEERRGRAVKLPAQKASRTALSSVTTAEYRHLYALRDSLLSIRFLEINPQAARHPNDRFETGVLKSDASNLAAVLAHLRDRTGSENWPDGVLTDISVDLASLIPAVSKVEILNEKSTKEYAFQIKTKDSMRFSSRVVSDGTLRLLALLAVLDDPDRKGTLCFEEPENGVHEGRVSDLVDFLRNATADEQAGSDCSYFQILVNTHAPAVMQALQNEEIIAADTVTRLDPDTKARETRTRMRIGADDVLDIDRDALLAKSEIEMLLRRPGGQI